MYLRFKTGEVIRVWSKDEKGWWDGEITGTTEEDKRAGPRRGWFPSNYVKDIDVSREICCSLLRLITRPITTEMPLSHL